MQAVPHKQAILHTDTLICLPTPCYAPKCVLWSLGPYKFVSVQDLGHKRKALPRL